jgi:hypothetical protein
MGRRPCWDEVFIDLHDMQAGEKWRETLVKANVACETLLFLASSPLAMSGSAPVGLDGWLVTEISGHNQWLNSSLTGES